jgi:hypothetical protein
LSRPAPRPAPHPAPRHHPVSIPSRPIPLAFFTPLSSPLFPSPFSNFFSSFLFCFVYFAFVSLLRIYRRERPPGTRLLPTGTRYAEPVAPATRDTPIKQSVVARSRGPLMFQWSPAPPTPSVFIDILIAILSIKNLITPRESESDGECGPSGRLAERFRISR